MEEDKTLQQAIQAIKRGQKEQARQILDRLIWADQYNPTYWLWMSAVVETREEQIYCLQSVLRMDPENRAAQHGLEALSGHSSPSVISESIENTSLESSPVISGSGQTGGKDHLSWISRLQELFSSPIWRPRIYILGGILVMVLMTMIAASILFTPGRLPNSKKLTITPTPWTQRPTATYLPTNTPRFRTATPTFTGPTPLWFFLEATYTPTPLYVETPHSISEAYRAGLRAFHAGDYTSMLQFMQQAAFVEPEAADAHYYVGEAYRLLGELDKALVAYDEAIKANPTFAPAYLGRARTHLGLDQNSDVKADLDFAVLQDPSYVEAYLERAAYYISHSEAAHALMDLDQVELLRPDTPLLFLHRARALLLLGEGNMAKETAKRAYDLDRTLIDVYLVLGEIYIELGDVREAIPYLETYTLYKNQDPLGWFLSGKAYFEIDAYEASIDALTQALSLDETMYEALLYRGYVHLEQGSSQAAIADMSAASKIRPDAFTASIGLGQALLSAARPSEAQRQINQSQQLAKTYNQLAQVYYWRALAEEALGNNRAAFNDWQALLELPSEAVPLEWMTVALERVQE